jgi:hypothetical protein
VSLKSFHTAWLETLVIFNKAGRLISFKRVSILPSKLVNSLISILVASTFQAPLNLNSPYPGSWGEEVVES